MPFLLGRLDDEERFLATNLPGYTEYQKRVRHRLAPFVWQNDHGPCWVHPCPLGVTRRATATRGNTTSDPTAAEGRRRRAVELRGRESNAR
jgi:hypothetical protein